jgi:flagellar biosynthesis protein
LKDDNKAVALSFSLDLPAPMLQAKGQGQIAAKLVHIAQELGIPIEQNPGLTEGLISFEPGSMVPEEYFKVLSQIFLNLFDFENGELKRK